MKSYLKQAESMHAEILKHRRTIHRFAETGFNLAQTKAYVFDTLTQYGYSPEYVGMAGVVATVGKPGKTILIRADMDALPIKEETGYDFASQNGNAHACGHDMHTAMLLGAAKLLKENEDRLQGTVKLMFQPAEELLSGAKDMIAHGILENPHVDAAFALHMISGNEVSKTGRICYAKRFVSNSGDAFKITVIGEDAHGSTPHVGVDAIHIAASIVLAFEELVSREVPMNEPCVLLVGKIEGGTSCNTVAGKASLEVSLRTNNNELREYLTRRIHEVATGIATTFRGKAVVDHMYGCPSLENNQTLLADLVESLREILPEDMLYGESSCIGGEDFAYIGEKVPTAFLFVGAGSTEEGYTVSLHNPKTRFNEDVLSLGAAIYAGCATRWLERNK